MLRAKHPLSIINLSVCMRHFSPLFCIPLGGPLSTEEQPLLDLSARIKSPRGGHCEGRQDADLGHTEIGPMKGHQ